MTRGGVGTAFPLTLEVDAEATGVCFAMESGGGILVAFDPEVVEVTLVRDPDTVADNLGLGVGVCGALTGTDNPLRLREAGFLETF
jgi:sugar lactone lactonase YvrE